MGSTPAFVALHTYLLRYTEQIGGFVKAIFGFACKVGVLERN
jgi:hypothetical protein